MSTFEQLRQGLQTMWDNFAEGWQQFRESAGAALTRFNPIMRRDNLQTAEDIAMLNSSRWGILATDVEESENEISVRVEAPGMEAEDFDIAIVQDHLVIRGKKEASRTHKTGQYHIMECAYGSFERAIPLPTSVSEAQAKAKYKRGVLTVTFPKDKKHQRRRIEVKSS